MRHALPRRLTILHSNIESVGFIHPRQRSLDARDGEEEVGELGCAEVGEAGSEAEGGDEDVAWEERFQVY